ncbi:MAG: DUF4403 family protein [Labilithrix sp.]|nr:DUF4403 family protein [Labilithrix sp.]MCW5811720.1 DUF4403 family protein [Labilithrix sp.]
MRWAALLFLVGTACGGESPKASEPVLCRTTLPPKPPLAAPLPPAPVPPPAGPSRVVAQAELKLASIVKELEGKVAPRIAEQRGRPIGAAGQLNVVVDRGPFSAAVENDALVVRTDVRARAEACKGSSCYASCAPEGRATATVSLRLGPDYRFAPSKVAFAFTKGCEVKVLGGFLRIDVTPTIAAEVQSALRRVEQQIDASLPPLKPRAEKLWAELAKPRPLPLGGCAIVNPRGLAQGPIAGTPELLAVRIGVSAYPEVRSQPCEPAAPAPPLPPLAQEPAMPEEDDVLLGLVSPLASAAGAIQNGPVTRAAVVQSGAQAQVDVTVRGESCGDAAALANVAWADDRRSLHFDAPEVVTKQTFAPAIDPSALPSVVPALAAAATEPGVAVSAKVSAVKPKVVVLRGGDVVASVAVRGNLTLTER